MLDSQRKSQMKFELPPEHLRVRVDHFPKPIVESRSRIPELLNKRGLSGEGALVGTFDGGYAESILREWNGTRLTCVDAWLSFATDADHVDRYSAPQWKLDHAHNEAHRRLNCLASRARIVRMRPDDAARLLPDGSLSFVYIDERQDFASIWNNLEVWSPKVMPGGIVAGSNYIDGEFPEGRFEVKTAVDTWARQQDLKVDRSGEPVWSSWIICLPTLPASSNGSRNQRTFGH